MKKYNIVTIKIILKVTTLILAIWALIVAYQAKKIAEWVDAKQDNVIEVLLNKYKP